MGFKISLYDFLNKFLMGLIIIAYILFAYKHNIESLIEKFYEGEIAKNSALTNIAYFCLIAIVYEMGIIINRLGSLLEELMRITKIIPYDDDYKKFSEVRKEYPIMSVLSREYALSRSSMMLFVLITILTFVRYSWYGLIPSVIVFVFYGSCYKYASKMRKLMKS